jgi:FAD:protein FMN transferase
MNPTQEVVKMRRSRSVGIFMSVAVIVAVVLVAGCSRKPVSSTETRKVLGTPVTISIYDPGVAQQKLRTAYDEAFGAMSEVDQKALEPGSDNQVFGISEGAGEKSISADPAIFEMLMESLRLYDQTGKIFDIRYGPMLDQWGFGKTPRVPTPAELDSTKPLVDGGGMFVAGNSILLAKKGMRFDVREIATGYAFDLAAAKLAESGIRTAMISSPRVCRTMGDVPTTRGFKWTLSNPVTGDSAWAAVWVPVGGAALASVTEGRFQSGGKWYHSLLDPRTGMPADKCAGAIVQAADGATAQALAYSVFVLGGSTGLAPEGTAKVLGSVLISDDGGKLAINKSGSLAENFETSK